MSRSRTGAGWLPGCWRRNSRNVEAAHVQTRDCVPADPGGHRHRRVFVLAWHLALDPIEVPAAKTFEASQLQRGEMLASAGSCATCRTAERGARNAGSYPLKTGFGTSNSTNITPDPATGFGNWSEAVLVNAMREGIAHDGTQLYPAFLSDHVTESSDEDVSALYAYLMSLAAVSAPTKGNKLPFPFDVRALQAGWKLLFLDQGCVERAAD